MVVNATKERYGEDDLEALFDGARKVVAMKGKKITELDLGNEEDAAALASVALRPTGNLRAPTARSARPGSWASTRRATARPSGDPRTEPRSPVRPRGRAPPRPRGCPFRGPAIRAAAPDRRPEVPEAPREGRPRASADALRIRRVVAQGRRSGVDQHGSARRGSLSMPPPNPTTLPRPEEARRDDRRRSRPCASTTRSPTGSTRGTRCSAAAGLPCSSPTPAAPRGAAPARG